MKYDQDSFPLLHMQYEINVSSTFLLKKISRNACTAIFSKSNYFAWWETNLFLVLIATDFLKEERKTSSKRKFNVTKI